MPEDKGLFVAEKWMVTKMKKCVIMVLGSAAMKYMKKLKDEQELLLSLADMVMETYAAESVMLRTEKLVKLKGEEKMARRVDMAQLYLYHAISTLRTCGEEAILAFTEGKEQKKLLAGLEILTKGYYPNTKDLRRRIASELIEQNKYCF